VCVRIRWGKRKRKNEGVRESDREKRRERECVCVCVCWKSCVFLNTSSNNVYHIFSIK
jgi:hypothetical protein